jgi:hypothetical protein
MDQETTRFIYSLLIVVIGIPVLTVLGGVCIILEKWFRDRKLIKGLKEHAIEVSLKVAVDPAYRFRPTDILVTKEVFDYYTKYRISSSEHIKVKEVYSRNYLVFYTMNLGEEFVEKQYYVSFIQKGENYKIPGTTELSFQKFYTSEYGKEWFMTRIL